MANAEIVGRDGTERRLAFLASHGNAPEILQVAADLSLAQGWSNLRVVETSASSQTQPHPVVGCYVVGLKPQTGPKKAEETVVVAVGCFDVLSIPLMQDVFRFLDPMTEKYLLGIVAPDTTTVYYYVYRGIVKSTKSDEEIP